METEDNVAKIQNKDKKKWLNEALLYRMSDPAKRKIPGWPEEYFREPFHGMIASPFHVCRQQKWEFWVAELAESFSPRSWSWGSSV